METVKQKLKVCIEVLKKYKYSALILAFGVILMCIPSRKSNTDRESDTKASGREGESEFAYDLNRELQNILMQMEGVGEASVLITYDMSQEQIYQQDIKTSVSGNEEESEYQTVKLSQNGNDVPLVVRSKYPTCRGVVVVCQGADRATVRLEIIRAVSDLTGLNSEHISVIKMKGS